jgi:CubicO group peptidase (beta-lactamase class C family)
MKLNHLVIFYQSRCFRFIIQHKPDLARNTNTGFMYCNTNYALLALIVEKVTANPFPLAMQKIVFKPLGMEHTYIFQQKDSLRAAQSFYIKEADCILEDN